MFSELQLELPNYHGYQCIYWSSRSDEKWAATWKFLCHARLKIHNKCFNSAMVLQNMAKFPQILAPCEDWLKVFQPRKVKKTWQEKLEKVGKIISMDFTARLKSCSTKTKFDNLFKTNRKVAQDSWARFATFWEILSFKLKKLFKNYHALSKIFVEWLPTTAVVIFEQLFQFER